MQSGARTRLLAWLLVVMAMLSLGTACRISSNDVERWSHTKQGPKKLIAVLTHEKYSLDLRVDAAMTLVEMRPRNGKRVGIVGDESDEDNPGLIAALADLPPGQRNKVIARMVPKLIEGMTKPVPEGNGAADPSFPYKDTAYALLTFEQDQLIASDKDRESLRQALAAWCSTDFARRVDDASQLYGVEAVLKYLKAEGVRAMPELLEPDAPKIDLIAKLIADLGDDQTKLAASQKLVDIAKHVNSPKWRDEKAPTVRAANEASKLSPTKEQFEAQLEQYQEETLMKVFGSMKKVGGGPIVDYLLEFATVADHGDKKRAAALAALEGNIVKCKAKDCDQATLDKIEKVMSIARSDNTPDVVRDQALRRVGEMPRQLVVDKLYDLFGHEKWKIRWMAADLVMSMSKDSAQVEEFMAKLSEHGAKLAISEPLQYGFRLGELKGKIKPEELADRFAKPEYSAAVRTTALSYYFHRGEAKDLGKVTRYETDTAKVPDAPACDEPMGCAWECEVSKGKESEVKEVKTIGEFVTYCVKPAMEKRKDDPKKKPGSEKKK
jgi:hypothetical protein